MKFQETILNCCQAVGKGFGFIIRIFYVTGKSLVESAFEEPKKKKVKK